MELNHKVKLFLDKKMVDSELLIKKLVRKRKYIKILYYSTTIMSIIISSVLCTLSATINLPGAVISTLSILSAIMTGISTKFQFKEKNYEISREIDHLNNLKNTIEYVVSCNGNLTEEKFKEILSKFQ